MSFSSHIDEAIIITDLNDGDFELLDRVPSESEDGWDTLRDRYLLRNDAAGIDPADALTGTTDLDRGEQITGLNMWIVSRSPRCVAPGLFEVEVTSIGLLSPRGYRVTYDAAAATQNINNGATLPVVGFKPKVQTREGGVTATFSYILVGSVTPGNAAFPTVDTSRAKNPPTGWIPTVPATIWSWLGDPTYHYPNGWILEGTTMENIPGIDTVWLVRDKYIYQIAETP